MGRTGQSSVFGTVSHSGRRPFQGEMDAPLAALYIWTRAGKPRVDGCDLNAYHAGDDLRTGDSQQGIERLEECDASHSETTSV